METTSSMLRQSTELFFINKNEDQGDNQAPNLKDRVQVELIANLIEKVLKSTES